MRPRPSGYDRKVALVLQGGGALGSYQAGVYAAIAESDYLPDWVAGISIGAINAALIAGNPPAERVTALRRFWERVTTPLPPLPGPMRRQAGASAALLFGQPGFFAPRAPLGRDPTHPAAFYDTAALRETLRDLVDFDRINARETAFSVAAVNVRTGNFVWFDNRRMRIRPEHVMASGALPPGFPAVEIDGEMFWDAGLVSNTPLQYVLDYSPRDSRLTFQVDVFSAAGELPVDLDAVTEREKDIRYASRSRAGLSAARDGHNIRHAINDLWERLPPDLRATPEAQRLYELGCVSRMDVALIIYRPDERQGASKDYEFSRATMQARWDRGLSDARATLEAAPWLAPMPPEVGARSFDVLRPPNH